MPNQKSSLWWRDSSKPASEKSGAVHVRQYQLEADAHTGLKAAIQRVFEATWQRCRVHWIRNALAHVPKGRHTVVAATIRQAFNQPDRDSAGQTWRHVADQLRAR